MVEPLSSQSALDALAERGLDIYNNVLKAHLEPEQNGRVVAIHIDSSDYATGRNSQEAVRNVREHHPQGRLVILTIGPEPDYALAARALAGAMVAGQAK